MLGNATWADMMEFRPSIRRKAAGFSLLGLGALGMVLPVLQGFLFLALALFVLRHQYLWAHRGMAWIEARWPGAVLKAEALEGRCIAWFGRQSARAKRMFRAG